MSTTRAVNELWDALCALREPFVALSICVWEDRPENDQHMLADDLGDSVVKACGWLEGAIGAVRQARDTTDDPTRLRAPLIDCGEEFARLEQTFWSEVASHDRLASVDALADEREAWSGWAAGVGTAVAECSAVLHDARAALLSCWRELTIDLGRSLVTVNSTNVGQQIKPVEERA